MRAVEDVEDGLEFAEVDIEALEVLEVLLGVVADEDDVAFWLETGEYSALREIVWMFSDLQSITIWNIRLREWWLETREDPIPHVPGPHQLRSPAYY